MADGVVVPSSTDIDASTKSLDDWNISAILANKTLADSTDGLTTFSSTINSGIKSLDLYSNALKSFGVNLDTTGSIQDEQIKKLTLLGTALVGAKDRFNSFNNGIDTKGLNLFKTQVGGVVDILDQLRSNGTGGEVLATAMKNVGSALESAHVPANEIAEAASKGAEFFGAWAMKTITLADNHLKLGNAFIQTSAAAGNMNKVMELSGKNFEGLDTLINQQNDMMNQSIIATGATAEEMESYYASLGKIPGVLEAVVKGTDGSSKTTTMLTAAIQAAKGEGRTYEAVMNDVGDAFKNYGIKGEDALKFSAKMNEVTQNLGINFETTKSALEGAANTLSMYTNSGAAASRMTDGLAQVMSTYGQSLEATGLSGVKSAQVLGDLTSKFAGLSIAQKSFLSAQTGGPGGLMGSFKIDKMMRDGDTAGITEMVRKQMTKQFGHVVTLDEASKSEGAAKQMTRQMALLQQGPLGKLANSPDEAERMLEGVFSKDAGKGKNITSMSSDVLGRDMKRGDQLRDRSYTPINAMLGEVTKIRSVMESGAFGIVKSGTAANSKDLKDYISSSENYDSKKEGLSYNKTVNKGKVNNDISGQLAYDTVSGIRKLPGAVGESIGNMGIEFKSLMPSDNQKEIGDKQYKDMQLKIKNEEAEQQKRPLKDRNRSLINAHKEQLKNLMNNSIPQNNLNKSTVKNVNGKNTVGNDSDQSSMGGRSVDHNVKVTVDGFCIKCQREIDQKTVRTGHENATGKGPSANQ